MITPPTYTRLAAAAARPALGSNSLQCGDLGAFPDRTEAHTVGWVVGEKDMV
jgi:hypothetical protein